MRSLSKSFVIIVMIMCMFSYMTGVSAATTKLSTVEKDSIKAVIKLLGGSTLSEDNATSITSLLDKYTLYTKYEKIDDTLYSKYKSNTNDETVGKSIADLISDPNKKEDLDNAENGWRKIESAQVEYTDLEKDSGYLVALMAVSKSDETKIYSYKTVYQATSDTTLSTYSDIANNNVDPDATVEDKSTNEDNSSNETTTDDSEEPTDETVEEKEEKSDTNPETGISDYAIYLVPLSIIAGSTLMIRRRFI